MKRKLVKKWVLHVSLTPVMFDLTDAEEGEVLMDSAVNRPKGLGATIAIADTKEEGQIWLDRVSSRGV